MPNKTFKNYRFSFVVYLIVEGYEWQIVDFEAVGHESNATTFVVEMCDHNHFVAELEKTLRQLIDMAFDSAHVRIEKVRDHAIYACILINSGMNLLNNLFLTISNEAAFFQCWPF